MPEAMTTVGVRVCRQPDIVYQAKVALMLADPGDAPEDPWCDAEKVSDSHGGDDLVVYRRESLLRRFVRRVEQSVSQELVGRETRHQTTLFRGDLDWQVLLSLTCVGRPRRRVINKFP